MPQLAWFVSKVVVGNPLVVLILGGDWLPEPDGAILTVLEVPEVGISGTIIRVPICILGAGHRVHVNNSVDALHGENLDDAFQVPEAAIFENPRIHVVLEVLVRERHAAAVYTNETEESSILISEEVIEEAVEEEVVVLRSHDSEHCGMRVGFGPR